MRLIMSIFKWTIILFVAIAALGLILPQGFAFLDGMGKDKRADYLRANTVYSGPMAGMDNLNFPTSFYSNRLFLFGEMHGVSGPQTADLALMNHLKKKIGLRWHMAELGPETALAFNHFLVTGDDQYARQAFDGWAAGGFQWANRNFYDKLVEMRAANLARAPEQRIYFLGVDHIQHQNLVDNRPPVPDVGSDEPQARIAARINRELLQATLARNSSNRYTHILENIDLMVAAPEIADEPLYGFWGLFHSLQTTVNGTAKPLAVRLKDHHAFANGITSMVSQFGPGSFMMWPGQILPSPMQGKNGEAYVLLPIGNDNPYMGYTNGIRDLESAANGAQISIFNMDATPSPYADGKRLVKNSGIMTMMQKFEIDGNVSQALDYLVYFEGSPALTPWKGEVHDLTGRALN